MSGKIRTVYFARPAGFDGPIKIGCSIEPAARVLNLAIWSPFPLELIGSVPGSYQDETFLHKCFADSHSHHEWFRSSPALRDAIATILAAGTVDILRATHIPKGDIRSIRQRFRTPEKSLQISYSARVNWASRKLRRLDEYSAWSAPDDVDAILSKWRSNPDGGMPSVRDIGRLEEYIANPALHSVVHRWPPALPDPAINQRNGAAS